MYKKTIKYVDYNGNERNEDHYFNLNETELAKMELSVNGGLKERLERLIQQQNIPEALKEIEGVVEMAYGVKSADGRTFDKDPKHWLAFKQSEAYNVFFKEVMFDAKNAAKFINAIVPAHMSKSDAELAAMAASPVASSDN
jgi:hypothetical protein